MHFHLNAVRRPWNIACNNVELLDVAGISEPALTDFGCLVSVAADESINDTDQGFFSKEVESLKVEYNVGVNIIYIVETLPAVYICNPNYN